MADAHKVQLAPSAARRASLARRTKSRSDSESSDSAQRLTRTAGAFKDYLCGLDHVRGVVTELESELAVVLREFYDGEGEAAANARLRAVSADLDQCNAALERGGAVRLVVDSESQVAALINRVRGLREETVDQDLLSRVADFWEGSRTAGEATARLVDRFQRAVLDRLRVGCGSYKAASPVSLAAPEVYSREVADYLAQLDVTATNARLLVASAGHKLNGELISKSSLLDRLLRGCDDESFPYLQLIPDLTFKMETMFAITRRWLDRDETYVFEIGEAIRETKSETKKKEEEMRAEKEKQRDIIKSVKSAFLICQNSKRKIKEIAEELGRLEKLMTECSSEERMLGDEKAKKENMAEFLEISITQTRRNYNLQLRRQKLMRQVNELEGNLNEIQEQIAELKAEMNSKSSTKEMAEKKHNMDELSYNNLKTDLDAFTKNVMQINSDINSLRGSISELERIQIFKTSPERVDDFFERPRSVKLAPSLQQKISMLRSEKS